MTPANIFYQLCFIAQVSIREENIPASASLEKFPVQVMKVWPSCCPEVTGYARMVLTTLV